MVIAEITWTTNSGSGAVTAITVRGSSLHVTHPLPHLHFVSPHLWCLSLSAVWSHMPFWSLWHKQEETCSSLWHYWTGLFIFLVCVSTATSLISATALISSFAKGLNMPHPRHFRGSHRFYRGFISSMEQLFNPIGCLDPSEFIYFPLAT